MKKREYSARYALYITGLYILGFALALIIRSSLGTSPISSWEYVMSRNTALTVGTYTFIINVVMIFIQCLVLHKHGLKGQLVNIALQIPFSFVFAQFIDFNMQLLGWLLPTGEVSYPFQLTMLILGCFIQALGILCEVKAGVSMMSAEALVNYICVRWKKEFGRIKVRFDVTLVLLAVLFSIGFALRDGRSITDGIFSAVREGTIVAALAVGHIVRWYDKIWTRIANK